MAPRQVYLFCSLPFGLVTAPFVFTKVTKALIRYWRSCGLRIFKYLGLDDGAGAESDQQPAQHIQPVWLKNAACAANKTPVWQKNDACAAKKTACVAEE